MKEMKEQAAPSTPLVGVDFTSNPSRRKPITLAWGTRQGDVLQLDRLAEHPTFDGYDAWLRGAGPWLGAFDFPFGLPRAFVDAQSLGDSAALVLRGVHAKSGGLRMGFRRLIDEWGNTRPAGQRLLHRRCDTAMGNGIRSTSPLQTRYVPVGLMYFEGMRRLLDAGVHIPGLQAGAHAAGDTRRIAVEAYPGLLAHELIARRSYKNRDAPDRLLARRDIVDALVRGRTRLGLRLHLSAAQQDLLLADPSGDRLDAVLCLVQAAWCSAQPPADGEQPGFGLPAAMDAVEGWIATVPCPSAAAAPSVAWAAA